MCGSVHSFVAVSLYKDTGMRSTSPLILVQFRVAQFSFIDFWGKFAFLQQMKTKLAILLKTYHNSQKEG